MDVTKWNIQMFTIGQIHFLKSLNPKHVKLFFKFSIQSFQWSLAEFSFENPWCRRIEVLSYLVPFCPFYSFSADLTSVTKIVFFTCIKVVDLCTAWKVLSVKLSLDKRPSVLCSLCLLFTAVPSLATSSQDYQVNMLCLFVCLFSLTCCNQKTYNKV